MKTEKNIPYKIYLDEQEMPKKWYNVRADMKNKGTASEPRHTAAHDSRGAWRSFLR